MEKIVVYHGSNVVVPEPKIMLNGHYKDFGYEFYCTNIKKTGKTVGFDEARRVCSKYIFLC